MDRVETPLLWKSRIGPLRGLRILQRKLGQRQIRCSYFGARFSVDLNDHLGFDIATGRYEHADISRFMNACRRIRPAVPVDVGAHIGVYSCIVGAHRLAGRIVALEPEPEHFAALRSHIIQNGLQDRVELIQSAAGANAGRVAFMRGTAQNGGLAHVSEEAAGDFEVQILTLDELDLPRGRRIAIKIDVEGYESPVLFGASDLLTKNSGYAQIETLDDAALRSTLEFMGHRNWLLIEQHGLNAMFEKAA